MSFLCFCSFFSGGGVRLEIRDPWDEMEKLSSLYEVGMLWKVKNR
jgi:hypothetical protein